ncbi:MAG: bifunctional pyr operon transcriptional regulator/uracil phosphoribosyltransferase PyrR [Cyclobacteriaceae bacterium]|nr:bifunctional pyr operon transcriptional regulator/uracil phosphoribosyltransferase PyrR [Cyclobacteriaceae bacterium]
MQQRLLLDSNLLQITILRLCQQLIESHDDFRNSVIIGLQPRGIFLANRIKSVLETLQENKLHLGYLDPTFHRDDFRRREQPLRPAETRIDFAIEGKNVILVDDVLYTGRSVRAALDAMSTFGRPNKVEYLVLIDRLYSRDVPIEANYIGKKVNTLHSQRVKVELKEQGGEDNIWLMNKS